MALRIFEHFPDIAKCPLCGKSNDSECFLAGVDGTQEGNNEQAIPVHVGCLDLRFNGQANAIYQACLFGDAEDLAQ